MEQYNEALSACEGVLQKDAGNVKALYRAGRVLSHLGEMENAVAKLQKALALNPDDKAIQIELKKVSKKRDHTLQKEKAMYRRMVGTDTASQRTLAHKEKAWVSITSYTAHTDFIAYSFIGTIAIHGHCRYCCCPCYGSCILLHPKTRLQLIPAD